MLPPDGMGHIQPEWNQKQKKKWKEKKRSMMKKMRGERAKKMKRKSDFVGINHSMLNLSFIDDSIQLH